MSRSAFSFATSRLSWAIELLRLYLAVARKGVLRILGELLHPIAQLRRVNVQVLRCLHIGHASILDQAHGLKLELPRELPSLHDPPPAPSKHLTRCLRNRVQAISLYPSAGLVETRRRSHLLACSVYPLLTLTALAALAASAQQQVSLAVLLHPLEHHVQAVA